MKTIDGAENSVCCRRVYARVDSFVLSIHASFISVAPLRVRSAKRRHQSPVWAILSQVDRFIQP